jgi:hypothetical protein
MHCLPPPGPVPRLPASGSGHLLDSRCWRVRVLAVKMTRPPAGRTGKCRRLTRRRRASAAAADPQVRAGMSRSGPGWATMHRVFAGVAQQAEQPSCKQFGEQAVAWHLSALGAKLGTYSACPSSCLRISSQPLRLLGAPCALSACGGGQQAIRWRLISDSTCRDRHQFKCRAGGRYVRRCQGLRGGRAGTPTRQALPAPR